MSPSQEHHLQTQAFKHMWARHVAQKAFEEDVQAAAKRVVQAQALNPDLIDDEKQVREDEGVSKILKKTQKLTGTGFVPRKSNELEIGIIGAGVGGLFTAMVFDWLNEECKDLGLKIDYDIIEAAKMNRLGGRLYAHRFSYEEHDYYDVGAMRFPNNTIMKRTFQLFNYIGLKPGKGGLIPYYIDDEENVCPTYFNDVSSVGNVWTADADDPFKINSGLPDGAKIPEHLLKVNPSKLVSQALEYFLEVAKGQFKKAIDEKDENGKEHTKLWELLMESDKLSTRQFLASGDGDRKRQQKIPLDNSGPIPEGPGFNYNTIEWLESATYGTGWYDQSLTECVLEELDFGTPETPGVNYWWCVDGGSQTIARRMAKMIKKPVQYNSQVVAIDAQVALRKEKEKDRKEGKEVDDYTSMKLRINKNHLVKEKEYFAVFNSTTLGALQRMDLKDAGLLWGTKQAIRALGYGASCKVGIKFETAWWQKAPFNIKKGGIAHTDLPLRVCVYPSYNIESNEGPDWDADKPAVLLCSYTWGQDAQRIGSLISPDTPKNEEQLLSVLLHDLALLHSKQTDYSYDQLLALLKDQYQDHHAYDWYRDENMSGAFAYFGPSQFSNMWQEIIKPNAYGQLYLIGEASSSHHAWIVGALESVIRAVYLMFEGLQKQDPDNKAYKRAIELLSKEAPQEGGDVFGGFPGDKPQEPQKMPSGLPFHPLPEEMPKRQLEVGSGVELIRNPLKDATTGDATSLLFSSAMITLSLIESYFELQADGWANKPQ
ncbi:hypothetical protein F53441_7989 [Fusarium austroafricanum]|uniref:Amine oxidase domain-containing protein n=1 Tax=Fusarium austroafricanum TaxID=2364996 RepID=A0A8H4KGC6_9HYPO|nr:hypothetical protein F53441_7989 [Fusarium austroafricanum]